MGLIPPFSVSVRAIISLMPWSDKNKAGVPEIDFVFSNGADVFFSNTIDFVFREATIAGSWSDKIKV